MTVDRLSLGTAQLGMTYGVANKASQPTGPEAEAILSRAFDLGIRALDTAPAYGLAEERIGDFLSKRAPRSEIEITTKLTSLGDIDGTEVAPRVEAQLLDSLKRLQIERIDVYLIHDPRDLDRHARALIDALSQQCEKERIGCAGIAVYGPEEAGFAKEHAELEVIQHPYNVFDTRLTSTGTLEDLISLGRHVQLRSVFLQGLLTMDAKDVPAEMPTDRDVVRALRHDLESLGLSPVDAALAFALAVDAQTVVVGVDNVMQLDEIAVASGRSLDDSVLELLSRYACPDRSRLIDPRTW